MAGHGPVPKDPSTRVRRNKGGASMRVVEVLRMPQPELPTRFKAREDEDGSFQDILDWPEATRRWWAMWGESPLASDFTAADWSELEMCALLHAEFMEGNYRLAAELRLRTAKFGTTPEDRARLKIQFEAADAAEERSVKRSERKGSAVPKGEDPRLKLVQ
jgi:hypothetical protein